MCDDRCFVYSYSNVCVYVLSFILILLIFRSSFVSRTRFLLCWLAMSFLLLFISYRILSACCCADSRFSGVIVCIGSVNGGANSYSYYQLLAGQLCCAVFCVGQSTMFCVQFFVLVYNFLFTVLSITAYCYIRIF